jgi:DegV family protein with EDD domain
LRHPSVTIVPNRINIGGRIYREGVDLTADEALSLIARQSVAPTITPPSVVEYAEVYHRLARSCDAIISIHASREILGSWQNARVAAQQLAGSCPIEVIDSQLVDVAQGMLVRMAIQACENEQTIDEVVRQVRGTVERLYAVYCVESIDYLMQNRIMSPAHTILGTMLGIKPFLTLEEGRLTPIEKVKTRSQVLEHLVEFATEFDDVEQCMILHSRSHANETVRTLQERLGAEFAGRHFPASVYGATMAALIGADAIGLVIVEKELDDFEDDI